LNTAPPARIERGNQGADFGGRIPLFPSHGAVPTPTGASDPADAPVRRAAQSFGHVAALLGTA